MILSLISISPLIISKRNYSLNFFFILLIYIFFPNPNLIHFCNPYLKLSVQLYNSGKAFLSLSLQRNYDWFGVIALLVRDSENMYLGPHTSCPSKSQKRNWTQWPWRANSIHAQTTTRWWVSNIAYKKYLLNGLYFF